MKVICCKCQKEYLLEDNLFESENTNKPILSCPHCGFEHLLDFIPIDENIKPKKRKIEKLNLATTYYVNLTASRIANSNREDQSGSDDGDVVDWVKANKIILAIQVGTSKGPIARAYILRWRNVTDSGSFAGVFSTGEVKWATTTETVLVDDATLGSGNKLCTGTPELTWQDGLENEADNILPDSGTYSLADEYYTEFQWGLSLDDALDGKQYEFELYDATEFTVIGTCLAQITTEAEQTLPQTNSRIGDIHMSWQGACDVDIVNWIKTNDFVLSTYATGGDGTDQVFKLQWKESGGSFVDVGATGAINYTAQTDLVDEDPVGTPAGCLTSTVSEENEGNSLTGLITMYSSSVVEIQWALNISGAADGTTYEFQLLCAIEPTSAVCSCSIRTAAGDITAYKDIALKTTLESTLTYKDIALKTTLESIPIYKDVAIKISFSAAPSLGYKDINLKTTLESALTYKDIALKTTLESALTYKDISLKTTLESIPNYKDITLKTSLESIPIYKDITLKTSLHSLDYKDITLKTSFSTAPILDYKDIALKTTLESIPIYKDVAIKTTLESIPTYKDVALKTTLNFLGYKDVAIKTSLELGQILDYKDVALKTSFTSALTYKDISLKTTLDSLDYKDITLKTTLNLLDYKDVALKVSLESEATVDFKDITLKTSITSAPTYKDISLKTTIESIPTYKDVTIKTSLHSLDFKDITLKTSLHSLDYKDITLKVSLHSLDYKDIVLKTSLESALTYKDIILKTSLDSLDFKDITLKTSLESALTYKDVVLKTTFDSLAYKDIVLKTTLNYLGFKDVALKTSLELQFFTSYKDISLKTSLDYYLVCFLKRLKGKIIIKKKITGLIVKKEINGKLIPKQKIMGSISKQKIIGLIPKKKIYGKFDSKIKKC